MNTTIESLEKELKEAAEKYRKLYENSPDMYVSVDPYDATIKDCNQTLARKTGYTKKEIIGQPVFFMYYPSCMPAVEQAFKTFVETGHVINAELELKKKDGTKIFVLLNVEAVKDEGGNILYSNSCYRDITEIKQLQQQLKDANKNLEKKVQKRTEELERKNRELKQFAYVASHDLQEPLRTVMSFVELLEKQYKNKLDANANIYLRYISQASVRMSTLVKGLLDYHRIGRNRQLVEVDCNAILKMVQEDLASTISKTKARLIVGELPKIKGYEIEIRLLFQNLLSNAIKFRKKDTIPKIIITVQNEDGWTFAVRDNGIGIADNHQERIFTIFQRLHARTEYEGTGIGLAHCQKIVELHGGNIWVDSKPNKGSTFYFNIPN